MQKMRTLLTAFILLWSYGLVFGQVKSLTEKDAAPCLHIVAQDMKATIEWRKEQIALFSPNGQYGNRPSAVSSVAYHRKAIEELTQTTPLQYANAPLGNGYFMKDKENIQTVRQELKEADEMATMLREGDEEKMNRIIGVIPTGLQLDSRLAGAEAKRCLLNVRLARLTGRPMAFQPATLPNRTYQDPAANYAFVSLACKQEIDNLRLKEPNLNLDTYIRGRMAWEDEKAKAEILRVKTDVMKREMDAERGYFTLCVLSARTALYQKPDSQSADFAKNWQNTMRPNLEASTGVRFGGITQALVTEQEAGPKAWGYGDRP
jgi:hypothetical protein